MVGGTPALKVSRLTHDRAEVSTGNIFDDAGCYDNKNQIAALLNLN
jgi:hypothetical protein